MDIFRNITRKNLFLLQLTFEPAWEDIAVVRKMLISLLSGKITNPDDAYRVGLVASELMENACKYSFNGAVDIRISYNAETTTVCVCLRNITNETQLGIFRDIYNQVHTGSPMASYKKMILRSTDGITIKRQLGLARVRYEGKTKINYTVEKDTGELLTTGKQQPEVSEPLCILKIESYTRVAAAGRE